MNYYKVEDRQLIPCPVNRVLADGSSVCNYYLLPSAVLEEHGWKSEIVEDPLPEYDPQCQELTVWYEDCGTYIARRWEIVEIQTSPDPTEMEAALEVLGVDTGG